MAADFINKIIHSNCLTGLQGLPDKSVHCCVTSPPYYGLRDYGIDEQIGLEETPEKYIESLVQVFTEVKRVLRDDGTLWLNIGDSYFGGGRGDMSTNKTNEKHLSIEAAKPKWTFSGYKPKDLIGIPWMLAFALRSSGWYLRQDIIWHKPNPMPESVTDRCTKSHEYIFLLSKSAKYYYDAEAIRTPAKNTWWLGPGGRTAWNNSPGRKNFCRIPNIRSKRRRK
jgi:DNA modification methylase